MMKSVLGGVLVALSTGTFVTLLCYLLLRTSLRSTVIVGLSPAIEVMHTIEPLFFAGSHSTGKLLMVNTILCSALIWVVLLAKNALLKRRH